ncbi:undecaprenyl-diphosphate phosphatase [Desulfolutivibrio sulfoxidireducens]|uniref:undecaprenyl-diphosphate phosphatase n=1 Tax=Desulfolutivibrio sulfoxidireducens TaxID=2773299 RepID=UPI00159E65A4|nr:undecaprenyl-diphosphate phosphatase [Desulfolutivibrio sulfoxidireducens]QLA16211.1 undecaprenyl-diphosphate phosphatase [Desulfolutivibrio sulfoxidireducens]QLA19891.1 undecaprenyl-diphosphate phosphatase [Desulfolutivibrio sulfoxidireducens]
MDHIASAVILGIVEGLTEFLPVSSTGHLILAGHLLGFTGPKADSFEIIIQLGAILAVVVMYRDRFLGLLRANPYQRFSGSRGIVLLGLTCLPAAVVGFLAHKAIKAHLFGPVTVAAALAGGAVAILVVEAMRRRVRFETLDDISPALALGIGFFQCLSLWPGFSRSAATIMGGMLLGAKRSLAAEYSFIAAVPIMFVATAYDFYKSYHLFEQGDLLLLAIGFVVSFFSAWVAVKGFILLLGRTTLRPFAWYRLVLAAVIFLVWPS